MFQVKQLLHLHNLLCYELVKLYFRIGYSNKDMTSPLAHDQAAVMRMRMLQRWAGRKNHKLDRCQNIDGGTSEQVFPPPVWTISLPV